MFIARFVYAVVYGTVKVQDTFVPEDSPTHHRNMNAKQVIGYLDYEKNLSDSKYNYATWYRNAAEFKMKKRGRKIRLFKDPQTITKQTNDSNSSNTSNSPDASNLFTPTLNCPVNFAPLSLFDPAVSKSWNDQMYISCDDSSITYTTIQAGVLTLSVKDNSIIVQKLQNMSVSVITPGTQIRTLKQGDKIDILPDSEQYLIVSNTSSSGLLFNAQDKVYFYKKGINPASADILPQMDGMTSDMLRVGVAPKWASYNDYIRFDPILVPEEQYGKYLRANVSEMADFVMARIFQQTPTPVKPTNTLASMNAFYSASGHQQSTILEYSNTIDSAQDACIAAFLYNQANPIMITILTEVVRRLLKNNKPELYMAVQNGDTFNSLSYSCNGLNKAVLLEAATIFGNLLRLDTEFDYEKVQKDARDSLILTACILFLHQSV